MRVRPLRLLLLFLAASLVVLAAMTALMFDLSPAVTGAAEFTPANIARARRIVESHDPRRIRGQSVRTMTLTADDLDLAVNYLTNRYAAGSATATLTDGRMRVLVSVPVPDLPARPFLNVSADVVAGQPLPTLERVRVGRLPVPAALVRSALAGVADSVMAGAEQARIRRAVRGVEFDADEAHVTYQWDSELAETVRGVLIAPDDRARLEVYQRALASTIVSQTDSHLSLAVLSQPLFALAAERSSASNPVAENRTALLVLTTYVLERSLRDVAPEAAAWPRPRRRVITLAGRDDSAKHYMLSALLAANTGGPFADAVGIYKEVEDSRGGSGFSFNDLAADRAGRRLGELAESPSRAAALQQQLRSARRDADLMPPTDGLEESLTDDEFQRRYGGVGGPGYTRVVADIDRRIATLPLYR